MSRNVFLIIGLLIVICFGPSAAFSQLNTSSFEQIADLQNSEKRSTVVFIHTDWCKYCAMMEKGTFKNNNVIDVLNKDFYFTMLNAESEASITFNQYVFKYLPTGDGTGIHQLAQQLATVDGKVSYPTLCILNEQSEIIFQYGGFLSAEDLLKVLKAVSADS